MEKSTRTRRWPRYAATLAAAAHLYGQSFNPQITLKALSWFGDGDLPNLPNHVKERLVTAARAVDLDLLPRVTPENLP